MPEEINHCTIRVKNLVTHYGDRKILNGVNLDILAGETMVILGRSGCGKSTLLRHLIGLQRPSSGEIYINDKDITKLSDEELNSLRTRMGVLFQGAALFNSMTIGDNVALPLQEHTRLNENTIQIMVRMKLSQVGLGGFEDYLPSQLSGGMKKRAGLARALAMDPEILFFDEPSAGLDPIVSASLDELILKLKKAFKITIVVVTHEMASAFLIADRITLLDQGVVLALGSPEEIKASTHPKVQQFLQRRPEEVSTDDQTYFEQLTK
jgi:phospholipid/cholesterol/gamma-HCH transport system ATP-binding protein